jgi:hypothetical protein
LRWSKMRSDENREQDCKDGEARASRHRRIFFG